MSDGLIIIGAGGVGREILAVLLHKNFSKYRIEGFCDDSLPAGTIVNEFSVLGNIDWLIEEKQGSNIIIAIGNPQVRKKILEKISQSRFNFPTIIHPSVSIHDKKRVSIGQGCFISDGTILTTDILIEDFCFINSLCSLQHDVHIGTGSVLMPGVRITGGANIGKFSYLAANCVIATKSILPENSYLVYSLYE